MEQLYRAVTWRIFYLTGGEKDYMYFGIYSSRKLAMFIAKIFAVIRDIATRGLTDDGIGFGVMLYEKGGRNDKIKSY